MPINPYYRPNIRRSTPFDDLVASRPELSPGLQNAPDPSMGAEFEARRRYEESLDQPPPEMKPQSKWKQALGYAASAFFPFSHTDIPERLIVGDENLRAKGQQGATRERLKELAGSEGERLQYGLESRKVGTGEREAGVAERNAELRAEELMQKREEANKPPERVQLPPKLSEQMWGLNEVPPGAVGSALQVAERRARPQPPTLVTPGTAAIRPGENQPFYTNPLQAKPQTLSPGQVFKQEVEGLANYFLRVAGGDTGQATAAMQAAMANPQEHPEVADKIMQYGASALQALQRMRKADRPGMEEALQGIFQQLGGTGGAPPAGRTVPGGPGLTTPPMPQLPPPPAGGAMGSDEQEREKIRQTARNAGITDPAEIEEFVDYYLSSRP